MELNQPALRTRLHTDARRARDLSCRYAFSWSLCKMVDIRSPGCAAGGDIEAAIDACVGGGEKEKHFISALVPHVGKAVGQS